MKLQINVPKPTNYGFFQLYVIGPEGDKYNDLVTTEEIEFDPDSLVIDLNNRAVLEKELNTIATRIFKFEYLYGRAKNLLDSLLHEESIYMDYKFHNIQYPPPVGKKEWTDTAKKAYLQATSLDDPIIIKLWNYIGKAKTDVYDLSICINALKTHLFKCKDFYNSNKDYYSTNKETM